MMFYYILSARIHRFLLQILLGWMILVAICLVGYKLKEKKEIAFASVVQCTIIAIIPGMDKTQMV